MPERPHPDLDRVRKALSERDERVPDPPETTTEAPEVDGEDEADDADT